MLTYSDVHLQPPSDVTCCLIDMKCLLQFTITLGLWAQDLLGADGANTSNMMQYLGILEQRIMELLQACSLLPPPLFTLVTLPIFSLHSMRTPPPLPPPNTCDACARSHTPELVVHW